MFEGLFQPMHLLVILGIALLVFGPRKLPELGKGLGDGIRSFRDSVKDKAIVASSTEGRSEREPQPTIHKVAAHREHSPHSEDIQDCCRTNTVGRDCMLPVGAESQAAGPEE